MEAFTKPKNMVDVQEIPETTRKVNKKLTFLWIINDFNSLCNTYFPKVNEEVYKFMLELIITNRYRLIEKLNIGAFYDVFRAIHIHNDTTVAIKIEQKSLG